jgi:uncharacterized protein (DUF427 family)
MTKASEESASAMADAPTESVWEYPRPPRLERCQHRIRVVFGGQTVAESRNAYRVLETSHPPTYYIPPSYIPPSDVRSEFLLPSSRRSRCEWKGDAHYWTLRVGDCESVNAAWSYPSPTKAFAAIRNCLAFYPARVEACFVGDEQVRAQEGSFYGGWITSNVRGPCKGGVGTSSW